MATENPYPNGIVTRVESLERRADSTDRWREHVETNGVGAPLIRMQVEMQAMADDVREMRVDVRELKESRAQTAGATGLGKFLVPVLVSILGLAIASVGILVTILLSTGGP